MAEGASLMLLLIAAAVILFIVWVLLPFAVFGIKPLLESILLEQRKTNAVLMKILDARTPARPAAGADRSGPQT